MNLLAVSEVAASMPPPRSNVSEGAAAKAPSRSSSTAAVPRYPNPILVLDAATGTLVLEYRNVMTGTVEHRTSPQAALRYRQSQHLATAS